MSFITYFYKEVCMLHKGDIVVINSKTALKRNGQEAKVKWTPSGDVYVTVVFKDGKSGKYLQSEVLLKEKTWQKEVRSLLNKGCSDSDLEDFVESHKSVHGKDIWDFVYEESAPQGCHCCEYIQREGMMPCIRCSRRVEVKDYYKPREIRH